MIGMMIVSGHLYKKTSENPFAIKAFEPLWGKRKAPAFVSKAGTYYGASGDTAFFKKHSNINGFRTPEQRNYLYSALLKQSISAAIARFISR